MAEIKIGMRQRSNTAANWTADNPVLLLGEIGFESDTNQIKIGDGVTTWTALDYIGGSGGIVYTRQTANYTASASEGIIADTTAASFTITLPATPSVGDNIQIADGGDWSANNLTIARNGSTIEGAAEDLVMDVAGVNVGFIYDGTTWQVYPWAGAVGSGGGGSVTVYTATATAAGWTGTDPVTNTISVTGMLATDTPIVDIDFSSVTFANVSTQQNEWAKVYRVESLAGQIKLYAVSAPTTDIALTIQVVR